MNIVYYLVENHNFSNFEKFLYEIFFAMLIFFNIFAKIILNFVNMNVKQKVVGVAALFFLGISVDAQRVKKDTVTKTQTIDEVVVLGYGKKTTSAKSTAASTTISSEVLENRPNATFLNSIQGASPGVSINSTSGSPGSGKITAMVRGLSSLKGSVDPLYVIDGLATSGNEFRNLNPNDIESISILRDAQATSIYGNRAAAGVVVITTKMAKFNSKLKVSYDGITSFSENMPHNYNLSNSKQLLSIQNRFGGGQGAGMTQAQIDAYDINTNWGKEFFRMGMTQQHNVGVQFGGENIAVFNSIGYMNNEGIIKGTDFTRFTFRNNITGKSSNGRLNYSSQFGLGYSKRNQLDQEENSKISSNSIQNVLFGGVMSVPTLDKYNFANGRDMYGVIGGSIAGKGPWILYDNMIGGIRNQFTQLSITGNVNISYKLTDDLTIANRSGIEFKENDRLFARDPNGYLSTLVAANAKQEYGGYEIQSNGKDFVFNSVTSLTYNKTFGDHNFTVAGYFDYLKGHYRFKSFTQNGLNPLNWSFGAGTGYVPFNNATPNFYLPSVSAQSVDAGTLAYFGTLDYDYAGKYGFGAILRRDGSYRFAPQNRWENFWSVSGRWNIDREAFMDGSSFRMLKLRGSYGTQGNQNVETPSNNFNALFLSPNIFKDLDRTGTGYQNLPSIYLGTIGNVNLSWEKVTQTNVGLDYNYKNIIEGSIDLYRKITDRLYGSINTSAVIGQYTLPTANNGKMENKGIEAIIRFNIIRNSNTKLSVFANGAYNKNTILALENQDLTGNYVNAIGGPARQWQLYDYLGVNATTGEQQYRATNGSVTEAPTANDRVLTGKSYLPKVTGGFGFDVDHKGFFISSLFSFQAGGWAYDNFYSWLMNPNYAGNGSNVSAYLLNHWSPTNTNTNVPSLKANNMGTEGSSTRFLYKTDFLRLKNVSFGYSFTKQQLANLPIKGMKIFVQGENLLTWTNWKGFDPEPLFQYSLSVYPNPRVYSFGVNVEF